MTFDFPQNATHTERDVAEEIDQQTDQSEPPRWKIIAHDDDVTTMDFVIRLMVQIFQKPLIFAEAIMWQIHNEGMSVVDSLPKAEAEFRVRKATVAAWLEGFPFRLTIEPDD